MFPVLRLKLRGLEPEAYYNIYLEIVNIDQHRYRYQVSFCCSFR